MQNLPRYKVAAEVRANLARHRKTQTDLATHLGISVSTLARRLSGDVAFDTDELALVADFFGVEVASRWPAA
jgi:transcriptional regulator with XRE-family HTH domain